MKLQQKIPLFIIVILLMVGGLGGLALLASQKSASTHMFEETASTLTDTILNSLEQDMLKGDRGHIQLTLDRMQRNENVRSIDILANDGRIWASSIKDSVGTNVSGETEKLLNSSGSREILGNPGDGHMTNIADIPVKNECLVCHGHTATAPNQQGNLGVIQVDISTSTLQKSLALSRQIMVLIGGFTFVLVAGTLVLLLRRTTLEPLAKLTEASARISHGDYSARVPLKETKDEITAVSSAFNEMAETVDEHTRQLEEANRQLEEANRQLAQANRLKSEFLANMSHELRTPLNVIIGFSEVLRDTSSDLLDDADRTEFCDNIVNSGHHLLELINDVLDLAKVEAGQIHLVLEDFHVGPVLKDILSTMQPLAGKKQINLSVKVSERLNTVFADAGKFRQIFYNLIGNAIKFTPEGGTVNINASVMGNMARFAVADTGIGIAPANQERIFSEFQQVDGSTSRQYEGTGLGLALTRKFVEMQKGEIWVESKTGLGSIFYFTLPIPQESTLPPALPIDRDISTATTGGGEVAGPARTTTAAPDPSRSPGVLIVEDDRKAAELIGLWLTQEGYEVEYAVDGVEALEKARASHPFAICLDIMLPRKDGWQVLHQLKSDPETADLGVIICSALENPELGFALGAADYCVKPLNRRHLLDKLRYLKEVSPGHRSQPQVLVADANAEDAAHTASILKHQGFVVIHAADSKKTLEMALEQSPDIIIIDFNLPEIPIQKVISFLRKHPITVNTPIIVTRDRDISQVDERRLLDSHIEGIIPKGESGRKLLLGEMFRLEKLQPEKALLIDSETRLFNRRYFDKRLAEEVKRAQRYSLDLSVLLIGLDHPAAGITTSPEERLSTLAGLLRSNVRAADPLARYDTDRFGMLLPETTKEAGFNAAKKIMELVREHQSREPAGDPDKLTVSIAIAGDHGGLLAPDRLTGRLEETLQALAEQGGDAARLA
ncbi:MAG: response regulator [Thermoleophilia bacterium]